MRPPGADTVVVRHGDIGVKSTKVQTAMERKLAKNIRELLAARGVNVSELSSGADGASRHTASVERQWSRLLVHTDEESIEVVTDAVTDAFGVISASPAVSVAPEMDAIRDALADAASECYDGGTFAVRAKRAGRTEDHPFTSEDLERTGGTAVWEAVEDRFDPEVDLDDPDLTFYVECRSDVAYVFTEKRAGPGGLPLGTQGRVVALISGGIDSPVAAWEMMKRGCELVPVYLDLGDYGGPDHEARAMETVRTLARYAPNRDMRVLKIPGGDAMELLVSETDSTRMLSFRRYLYRAAEHVAAETEASAVVTGEAIGQKSSQTIRNLTVTSRATRLPIHRPLLTMDKHEITARAREIGTYSDSTIPAGCNRIAPSYPETNASLAKVRAAEPDDLYERAKRDADRAEPVEIDPLPV